MLRLLMKAKFGQRFDPETLLHGQLADLIREMSQSLGEARSSGECFDSEDMLAIAKAVFDESFRSGWWSMSSDERERYLQNAASPWLLSAEQVDTIVEHVDDMLFLSRRVAKAADEVDAN
jgi:hypothetical protein